MGVGAARVLLGMALYPNRAVSLTEKAARILPTSFRRPLVDAPRAALGGLGAPPPPTAPAVRRAAPARPPHVVPAPAGGRAAGVPGRPGRAALSAPPPDLRGV